jgi:hypothetical protein
MEDVGPERPQCGDMGGEAAPVVIVAWSRHDDRPRPWPGGGDPVHNGSLHPDDGRLDLRLEVVEEMHEAEVGTTQLLRVGVGQELHARTA